MDKEFEEEFGMDNQFLEMLKEEDKMEILANAIASLSELPEFKEDAEAIMQMAETMIEAGFPPDPMELDLVDSKTKQAVVHLIAKKMGVKWTAQMGYGEMRMKQNYPESHIKKNADRLREMSNRIKEASKLPPHLAKFFDKKGNLKPEVAARIAKGREKLNIKDVTPKGYGPKEEVEIKEDPDLEKIVKELEGASKMHLGQSKRIQKHLDKMDKMNVEIGEAMNPKDHVKEKDGKFQVISPKGKVVYSSDDKKEAEEWAVKNHDALMKEGIDIQKADMKDVIKDFKTSDAPQFKGKSDKKRKEMAIAAKLSKEENEDDDPVGKSKKKSKKDVINLKPTAESSMKKFKDIMTKLKEKRFNVEEEVELDEELETIYSHFQEIYENLDEDGQEDFDVILELHDEGEITDEELVEGLLDYATSSGRAKKKLGRMQKKTDKMTSKIAAKKQKRSDDLSVKRKIGGEKSKQRKIKAKAKADKKANPSKLRKGLKKVGGALKKVFGKSEEVEIEESDGYEVEMAAKKISPQQWKRMSKAEKVRFLDKMDVLAGKTKVSDSDLEDILGDRGLTMEASGDKEAYQKFFQGALKKYGVKSPAELKGDKKKEFFDYVDKNWTGDHEEETTTKKSLKDAVADMKEKKLKVQEALTIGGVEVGEQDFDKGARLAHAAPNLGMTYADYQAKFKTDGLEGPYQIDGGAYFWDKAATKWFSVETEDYVDEKRNAELNFRYTKQGTAGGGLMHTRRL